MMHGQIENSGQRGGIRDDEGPGFADCDYLRRRNVVVNGRRTSMRLERPVWQALEEICRREKVDLNSYCERIDGNRGPSSLTSAVRVNVLLYYRRLAGSPCEAVGA